MEWPFWSVLYGYMAIITGINFTFLMDYPMGQGIYLGQLVEFFEHFPEPGIVYLGRYVAETDPCRGYVPEYPASMESGT